MRSRPAQPPANVCVTGASGFIATHVVRELLERGYAVVGTVRDPSDEAKNAHLRKLSSEHDDRLSLVAADLTEPGAFDEAVADCPYVCHIASAVRLTAPDPQRDIIDVAVHGTDNVLTSVAKAGVAERVVVTSSIAAVVDESKPPSKVFDEADWNESADAKGGAYARSKVEAERAAYAFVDGLPEAERFALTTILPSLVLGPVYSETHCRSSPTVLRDLMTGKFPLIPNFHFGVVDVREVARAHVAALEDGEASGRYILSNRGMWMRDMAHELRLNFPATKTPKRALPDFAMYGVALFDKRLSWDFLKRNLGVVRKIDNTRSREGLGIRYRSVQESVRDTAESFRANGLA